jgi:hypothetical protein
VNLQDVLVQERAAERSEVTAAERTAREQGRSIAAVLVEQGVVGEDVLADAAARAVGTVVIDIDQGALDYDSVVLVPREVARDHLLLPVAPDPSGRSLRVAFANPLDEEAVRVVQHATGMEVQPMVATVSGLQRAIEREYGTAEGYSVPPRSEMPEENTRRVESQARPTEPSGLGGTHPMHRLENEAPVEQRIEALLLALIDSGHLTRADYIEALRRLMHRD